MNESKQDPSQSRDSNSKRPSWYIDEVGNIKGLVASFEVDQLIEFTDEAINYPQNTNPTSA